MIIKQDSPLVRLPSQLNIKQTLFLDAIRFCTQMADMSFENLHITLLKATNDDKDKKHVNVAETTLVAMADAWAVIDWINRLRNLICQMPNVKKKGAILVSFLRRTEKVENLRHVMQHLNHEIDELIERKMTALGMLGWVVLLDKQVERCLVCSLQPGTIFNRSVPLINPVGKTIKYPIDQITLYASKDFVCLSDVMDSLKKLISSIENELRKQFKELPQAGHDLLIVLEIARKSEEK